MVENIDELNSITERNVRRNRFLFANPYLRFDRDALCSNDDEWIFPFLLAGRAHRLPLDRQLSLKQF